MAKLRQDGAKKGIVDPSVIHAQWSTEGNELWALKVGKGSKHKVLFTGCHHAREWISVEIPFLVAKYLIEGYTDHPGDDPEKKRIKHLVDNREIWFVPLVNPDGHLRSILLNRMWRPNTREHIFWNDETYTVNNIWGGSRTIQVKAGAYRGIDINRNYPTATWGIEASSTSRDPADTKKGTWVGPFANSEVETQDMVELISQGFRASMTYHNYAQYLLYPLQAEGDPFVKDLSKGMEGLINAKAEQPYKLMSDAAQYPTTGDLLEYCWQVAKADRPSVPSSGHC